MIARVQAHLEAIYGFTCEVRAEGFLVDPEAALRLGSTGRADEELLVHEGDGEVELALYLAPALLSRLRLPFPAVARALARRATLALSSAATRLKPSVDQIGPFYSS